MIDLTTWNLSIPTTPAPTTIETQQLANHYSSRYFYPATDGSGGVTFWTPVTGSSTENSSYPRSELRETLPDGTLHNWRYPEADNLLRAALAVTRMPSSNKVIVGQIHSVNTSTSKGQPLIKLQYHRLDGVGRIEALIRQHPWDADSQNVLLASGIPLNQRFAYSLHLSPGGMLSISLHHDGKRYSHDRRISSGWAKRRLFFKAGAYAQDNSGNSREGARVTFYSLSSSHL